MSSSPLRADSTSCSYKKSKLIIVSMSESPQVLVQRPPTFDFMDELLSRNFPILTTHHTSSAPLLNSLSRQASSSIRVVVNMAMLKLDADLLSHLPSLQLLVCTSVGTEHIDLAECKRRGIAVTNAGEAFSEDVADCAVGLLISVLRKIPAADRYVRSGKWVKFGEFQLGIKLSGKRVGILGLGSIGSLIAKRLEPFGCIISYNSTSQKQSIPYQYYPDALGKKGVIINVGRGGLIDEKEMKEPGVPEELFGLDNVVLSPHAAMATPGSLKNIAQLTLANLKAFFSNQPLISPVRLD
ncbi:BnaA09g47060D [Brassica napus]|uniref:BnaA09g47060D protein n=1 Tax=Brassica napus TaxID=3708 RepID=A0A078GMP4_BRANA|nr:BnaA09g47060D [Brassica napus]